MCNIEILHKNKSLSLFHINACSLLQVTSAGGTLLYIPNHPSYRCRNDLNISKKMNLNLLLLKLPIQKNQISLWESFTDIHL